MVLIPGEKQMKLKYIYSLLLLLLIALSTFAQTTTPTTISDVDVPDDIDLIITGTFAERKVTGKVVGVHDGDTITVLDAEKNQYKIRFNGIDAPELKMDFGNKAKESLSDMVFGKEVTVVFSKRDKYNRIVANVYINGMDVNLEQIKRGFAWHYKKYQEEQTPKDRKDYADAEIAAKASKKGLWLMENPTPPWDYRAQLKVKQAEAKANRVYIKGAGGGCYYINSSGNKTYMKDKSLCENQPKISAETNKSSTDKKDEKSEKKSEEKKEEKSNAAKENKAGRTYILGPKGGCYYLTESGEKKYEKDKSKCENLPKTTTETDKKDEKPKAEKTEKPKTETPKSDVNKTDTPKENRDGRTYIKGARGGCYYLDESGKKVYMKDKSLCN
jgi:endonuclease YncB( thermonuclease family)